jgi:hypothetical protein
MVRCGGWWREYTTPRDGVYTRGAAGIGPGYTAPMFNKHPALRRAVRGISAILILIPLGIGLYQRVSRNRTLTPVKLAISVASETGLEYPEAQAVSEKMRARYGDEAFARELEESVDRLRSSFEENEDHPPEIGYWLAAG